jgi:hypothetical protein
MTVMRLLSEQEVVGAIGCPHYWRTSQGQDQAAYIIRYLHEICPVSGKFRALFSRSHRQQRQWHKPCLLDKEWLHKEWLRAIPETYTGISNIGPIAFGAPLTTK